MQLTLNFEGTPTNQEIAARLRMQADVLVGKSPKEAATATPAGTTRASKKARTETPPDETFDTELEANGVDTDEVENFGEETEVETEEETEEDITLEQLQKGFAQHAKKHGKDKTMAILKKFKVKSARDLKTADYPKVAKALGL